jgi:putative tricarboxylic transport membrane protein
VNDGRLTTDDSRLTADDPPITPSPHHPITHRVDLGETILALAVIVFGLLVVWQTTQIRLTPAYSKVGPRVIPYIVGGGLVIIGIWLAVEALTGRGTAPSTESEDADPTLPTDWRTVGLLTLALVAYLLLLERAGFVIASAVLFVAAAYAMGSRRIVRDVVTGVVMATVLYVGFTRGLDLQLPAGVLAGLL